MVGRIDGGSPGVVSRTSSNAAAEAAAAAARRAAEEAARRAAEAARRAAEAAERARVAAEAAREAARQAEQLRQSIAEARSNPAQQRLLRAELPAVQSNAARLRSEAESLGEAARLAERSSRQMAEVSRRAMETANTAANTAGIREPFRRQNELTTGVDGPRGRRAEDALGTEPQISPEAAERTVAANNEYARLAQTEGGPATLQQLGIHDGASLRAYGERVARQAETGEPPRAGEPPLIPPGAQVNPQALASIIQSSGTLLEGEASALLRDPAFANAVAEGQSPREARREMREESAGLNEPEVVAGLQTLGLTEQQVLAAPPEAREAIIQAARIANGGVEQVQQAIQQLANLPETARDLATTGITALAERLPDGPVKALLQDREVVAAIAGGAEAAARLLQLAGGDFVEGLRGLAGDARDAAAEILSRQPTIVAELGAIGLEAADLISNSEHLQEILEAGKAFANGDPSQALQLLQRAGGELLERGLERLAENLPEGLARNLLSRSDTIRSILESPEANAALTALLDGRPEEAVAHLRGPVLDTVLEAIVSDPALEPHLSRLGITAADLRTGIEALPNLLNAARALADNNPREAIDQLLAAAETAPRLVEQSLRAGIDALNLPPGLARDLLTSTAPNVLERLVQQTPDAIRTLLNGGDLREALTQIGGDRILLERVSSVLMRDEAFAAQAAKLGITTPQELGAAAQALPDLYSATQALARGEFQQAALHIADAFQANPNVAQGALETLMQNWEGAPPLLRSMVENGEVVGGLLESGAIHHFIRGDLADGLRAVNGQPELRDAIGQILLDDPQVGPALGQLGIDTVAEVAELNEASAFIFDAVEALQNNDIRGAIGFLADAATVAPEDLLRTAIQSLAERWTDAPPVVQNLLGDEEVINGLLRNRDALRAIVAGGVEGEGLDQLAAGLEAISSDAELTTAVGRVLLEDPTIGNGLRRLGLNSAAEFGQAAGALPHLIRAGVHAANGEFRDAALSLTNVAETAPDLARRAMLRAGAELGPPISAILSNEAAVDGLLQPEGLGSIRDLINGRLAEGLTGLVNNEPVYNAVLDALATVPQISTGLETLGLSIDDLRTNGAAIGDVIQAIDAAANGRLPQALNHLLDAGVNAPDLVKKGLERLSQLEPLNRSGLAQALLQDDGVIDQLITSPELHDSIRDLLNGRIGEGLSEILQHEGLGTAVTDLLMEIPAVQNAMARFDLTAEDMRSLGAGLGHFIEGFGLLSGSDRNVGEALATFLEGAQNIPLPAFQAIAGKLAAHLPGDGEQAGILRELVSDPSLLASIVRNDGALEGLQDLFRGDLASGLRKLITSDAVANAIGRVLTSDRLPAVRDFLAQLGITTASQVRSVLADALPDALDAFQAISEGRINDALGAIGRAVSGLDDDIKRNIAQFLTERLRIPPEFTEVLFATLDVLGNPEVRAQFSEVLEGFTSGNPANFVRELAELGGIIAREEEGAAVTLLNSLRHLPGSIGEFFSNPDLNLAIVRSGSLEHMFGAVQALAEGRFLDAIKSLGSAIMALVQEGEHFQLGPYRASAFGHGVGPTLGPYELPFGSQGIENIGLLIGQFVEAMPPQVKQFIQTQLAEFAANAGFSSIPVVGPIYGVYQEGREIFDQLNDGEPNDAFELAIDVGQLVVNGARLFPPLEPALAPVSQFLNMVETVDEIVDMVGDMRDFAQQFTGMTGQFSEGAAAGPQPSETPGGSTAGGPMRVA